MVLSSPALAAPGDDAALVAVPFSALSTSTPGGTVTNKTATCPTGERIVGGGSGPGGPVDPSYLSLRVSGPFDETGTTAATVDGDVARIWSASIGNAYPTMGTNYPERIFANCSTNSDAVIEATTATAPGGFTMATSMCSSGTRAIGGGFATFSGDSDFVLRASAPVDETGSVDNTFDGDIARGWSVLVSNGAAASIDVYALCSQGSDATVVTNSFFADPVKETTVTANCPIGERALGGGAGTTTAPGPYLTSSAPVAAGRDTAGTMNGDVARGWSASVFNSGGPSARYLTFALCTGGSKVGPSGDTTPPETTIAKHPKRRATKRTARFEFSSSEAGGSFECKLDKGAPGACTSPFVKNVKVGRKAHHFSVVAIDAAGNRDASPATYDWKVKKPKRR